MSENKLKFDVGSVAEAEDGVHIDFDINEKVKFEEKNFPGPLHIKAKVGIMKIDRELNITAGNLETSVDFDCAKCLKKFTYKIKIPFIERQFLFERPRPIGDMNDLYLVDIKNMTIDLTELFRQEILLHFPLVPLCSLKCKGLCLICGKDLNKGVCGHEAVPKTAEPGKPMSHLKELFKTYKYGETTGTKEKSSAKSNKKTL